MHLQLYTSTLFAISCALLFAILFALSRVENSSSARFFSYSRCSLSVDLSAQKIFISYITVWASRSHPDHLRFYHSKLNFVWTNLPNNRCLSFKRHPPDLLLILDSMDLLSPNLSNLWRLLRCIYHLWLTPSKLCPAEWIIIESAINDHHINFTFHLWKKKILSYKNPQRTSQFCVQLQLH